MKIKLLCIMGTLLTCVLYAEKEYKLYITKIEVTDKKPEGKNWDGTGSNKPDLLLQMIKYEKNTRTTYKSVLTKNSCLYEGEVYVDTAFVTGEAINIVVYDKDVLNHDYVGEIKLVAPLQKPQQVFGQIVKFEFEFREIPDPDPDPDPDSNPGPDSDPDSKPEEQPVPDNVVQLVEYFSHGNWAMRLFVISNLYEMAKKGLHLDYILKAFEQQRMKEKDPRVSHDLMQKIASLRRVFPQNATIEKMLLRYQKSLEEQKRRVDVLVVYLQHESNDIRSDVVSLLADIAWSNPHLTKAITDILEKRFAIEKDSGVRVMIEFFVARINNTVISIEQKIRVYEEEKKKKIKFLYGLLSDLEQGDDGTKIKTIRALNSLCHRYPCFTLDTLVRLKKMYKKEQSNSVKIALEMVLQTLSQSL